MQLDAGIAEISVDEGSPVWTGAGSGSCIVALDIAALDALLDDDVQPEADIAEISFDGGSSLRAGSDSFFAS